MGAAAKNVKTDHIRCTDTEMYRTGTAHARTGMATYFVGNLVMNRTMRNGRYKPENRKGRRDDENDSDLQKVQIGE